MPCWEIIQKEIFGHALKFDSLDDVLSKGRKTVKLYDSEFPSMDSEILWKIPTHHYSTAMIENNGLGL